MQNNKTLQIILLILIVIGLGFLLTQQIWVPKVVSYLTRNDQYKYSVAESQTSTSVVYTNTEYGFSIPLPEDWHGYTVKEEQVVINNISINTESKIAGFAKKIIIRHPLWTEQKPYEDIPVLIFTQATWAMVSGDDPVGSISPAPFGPSLLTQNKKYVFALPPRYNYDYSIGWQSVEKIVKTIKAI